MPVALSQAKRLGLVLIASALSVINLGGCATPPSRLRAVRAVPSADMPPHAGLPGSLAVVSVPARLKPIVQYGRYTLIEISPTAGQEDLMQQIVDVSMPPTLVASVGDAVRYVLLRSGFVLCDSPGVRILNTLPLPSADFHLGPLTLKSALRILAGPGWRLEVNELTRRVCFLPASPPSPAGRGTLAGPKDESAAATARPIAREHRP
jgi:type IV pili sensor histidine kinase/response regulator